jgi:hypothetical protein
VTLPSRSRSRRSAQLLTAFDEAGGELEQVLAVLRASGVEQPEALTLGAGDRALLGAHRALTGDDVEVVVTCGSCEEVSSVWLRPEDLPEPVAALALLGAGGGLREPTYRDLLDLPDGAEDELLRRCTVGSPSLAPEADHFELVDNSLSGPLVIDCVHCGAQVTAPLDVEPLVLELLGRHLVEVDMEVHLLASRYGWALDTIEALPDARRRRLAELVAEGR